MAPFTHLVLDETRLIPGQLLPNGVAAVGHISNLINNQKIKCDFEFYQLEFNADVPVLCFSEGKSMLPTNCHVKLKPDPDCVRLMKETMVAVKHFLQKRLQTYRVYLTALKTNEFNMDMNNLEVRNVST